MLLMFVVICVNKVFNLVVSECVCVCLCVLGIMFVSK